MIITIIAILLGDILISNCYQNVQIFIAFSWLKNSPPDVSNNIKWGKLSKDSNIIGRKKFLVH